MDTAWKTPIKYVFPCAHAEITLVDVKHWKPFVITVQRAVRSSSFVFYTGWLKSQIAGTQNHAASDGAAGGFSPTPHSNPAVAERGRARGQQRSPNSWLMQHLLPPRATEDMAAKLS